MLGGAGGRREVGGHVCEQSDVVGSGAAAPSDHLHTELGDEPALVLGELIGGEVVVHLAVHHRRQAGVGQHRDGHAAVLGQVADVFAHLRRSGGAVETDDVDTQRVDHGEGGGYLGAHEHAAGELDGDLALDGHLPADLGHGATGRDHRRLHRQEVEVRLEDEEIDPALKQCLGGDLVVVPELREADLAEAGSLGAGTEGSGNVALAVRGGEPVGHLPCDAGVGQGDLVGSVGEVVLAERHTEGTEGVGLDDIGTHLEVGGVQVRDHIGAGNPEQVGAALERFTSEVVRSEVPALEPGAGRAVVNHDALSYEVEKGVSHEWEATGAHRRRGHPPVGSAAW